tara:strand:- start:9494 stop:9892 length:399 start_codon:yes stop_codon:yes gene_type:complete
LEPLFEEDTNNPVMIRDIQFYSMCEHHLVPFFGTASVGYIPSQKIIGLSKIARALDILCKRPQVQERLTQQLKESLVKALQPKALVVQIEAEHLCMAMRGVKKTGSKVTTMASHLETRGNTQDYEVLISLLK